MSPRNGALERGVDFRQNNVFLLTSPFINRVSDRDNYQGCGG
jgi:hypothetical protein